MASGIDFLPSEGHSDTPGRGTIIGENAYIQKSIDNLEKTIELFREYLDPITGPGRPTNDSETVTMKEMSERDSSHVIFKLREHGERINSANIHLNALMQRLEIR